MTLRHQVFFQELPRTTPHRSCDQNESHLVDIDDFDEDSDHLLVQEKASGTVVGTYRLRSSQFTDRFYSATEFDLTQFLADFKGPKLEIGRACIHPHFRRGLTIQLLWRGIVQYVLLTKSAYVFGCSSIANEPSTISRLMQEMQATHHYDPWYAMTPHRPYPIQEAPEGHSLPPTAIPPLLNAYIRAGAKLLGLPAYDAQLDCVDFFTVLAFHQLKPQHRRRYKLH